MGSSQINSESTVPSLKLHNLPNGSTIPSPCQKQSCQQAAILLPPPAHLPPQRSESRSRVDTYSAANQHTHTTHHVICPTKVTSHKRCLGASFPARKTSWICSSAAEAPSRLMPCVCQVRLKLVGVRIQTKPGEVQAGELLVSPFVQAAVAGQTSRVFFYKKFPGAGEPCCFVNTPKDSW